MAESNTSDPTSLEPKMVATQGLVLFKEGMISWFDSDSGKWIPVTVLRYEPHVVTNVREVSNTKRVQVAVGQKSSKKCPKAILGIIQKAGLVRAPLVLKELVVEGNADPRVGDRVDLSVLKPGIKVDVVGRSRGLGFAGSVKRFGFAGGPASHGSKFHRQPGSSGNRTWPGRIMPGKRFPGHMGDRTTHVKNLDIVTIDFEKRVVLVKGAVPGARQAPVLVLKTVGE